jgi:hypothetical protein
MYCPKCLEPNVINADQCAACQAPLDYLHDRLFIGQQFIFVQADEQHPVALKVDEDIQTYHAPAILSRHRHTAGLGKTDSGQDEAELPLLSAPDLKLLTVITDRKIYQPGTEAGIFIVASDAPEQEVALEIKMAGQKVYEAKVPLNQEGLALHYYADFKEGEYTAVVTLPDDRQAECSFSAAEFTLSPLIATLEKHEYAERRLTFTLKMLLLSQPYAGPVEFGLQCQVCGDRVVATQKVKAKDGLVQGDFDLSGHGGPFHVQVTTPDGHTALVSFPGTGAREREHIHINPLGQTYDAGLLPWADAQPVRGLYLGAGEVNMTPLMLESAHTAQGKIKAAADLGQIQIVIFNPRAGTSQVIEREQLPRGAEIEFDVAVPYSLFTVGAFTQKGETFEGWGVVFKPVALEATLTAPKTASPGKEIEIELKQESPLAPEENSGLGGSFCLLLVYDARLEHESPLPKQARQIYDNVRDTTRQLNVGNAPNLEERPFLIGDDYLAGAEVMDSFGPFLLRSAMPMMAAPAPAGEPVLQHMLAGADYDQSLAEAVETEMPVMVVAPTRMEFPELVHLELFYFEGEASRTVRLGDQIGTWRARAYVIKDVDCLELTADIQADKPLYAELDVPAVASEGDDITAAVNYHTNEPADLVVNTLFGEQRAQVSGSGALSFPIKGPGRVEVRLENPSGADWSVRDVAQPGMQRVTASRLVILDQGQTVRGEKVVVYATMGQVLKDTITALIHYPFG